MGTDSDLPVPLHEAMAAWEAKYAQFTAEYEERRGKRLTKAQRTGWRWCYVELNPLQTA